MASSDAYSDCFIDDAMVNRIMPGLEVIIPVTKVEVFLNGFHILTKDFENIMELSKNCRRLVLTHCQLDFENFSQIKFTSGFKIKELVIYDSTLGKNMYELIFGALSKTDLVDSLEIIHLACKPDQSDKLFEDGMLSNLGFKARLIVSPFLPISKTIVKEYY